MDKKRRQVREFLINSNREEFFYALHEAKLTPRQETIIELKFLKDMSYVEMSFKLNEDVSVLKVDAGKAYDKLSRFLNLN